MQTVLENYAGAGKRRQFSLLLRKTLVFVCSLLSSKYYVFVLYTEMNTNIS